MAKSYNPFSVFRKNQKVALALITLLSMFAFVCVGPSMFGRSNNPTPGSGPAAVLAKWDYGDITRVEVTNKLTWRIRINRFLANLHDKAAALGKVDPDSRAPSFQPESEAGILQTMVLEKKAELLGMSVSDKSVNDFIDGVTGGSLKSEDKVKALANAVGGRDAGSAGVLSDELFDNLRFELLAQNFFNLLTRDAIPYDTPEERWDYFSRLNRQATVETLPVAVKDFVDKVPNPESGELQALYDKDKDRLPQPESPEPGFMVPSHGTFQYFKAVRATLAKANESKITEKEIDDYYKEHKELFRKSLLDESELPTPSEKPKTGEKPAAGEKPATGAKPNSEAKSNAKERTKPKESTDAGTANAGVKPKESKTAPENPATLTPETKPATPAPSDNKKPAENKSSEGKPVEKKPADTKPADKKSADKNSSDSRPFRHRAGDEELLALTDTAAPPSVRRQKRSRQKKTRPQQTKSLFKPRHQNRCPHRRRQRRRKLNPQPQHRRRRRVSRRPLRRRNRRQPGRKKADQFPRPKPRPSRRPTNSGF